MTPEELKTLKKNASAKKRMATEVASMIHDVVEDTYWTDYNKLPEMAQQAIEACEAWKAAQAEYDQAAAEETA
ncbi:CCE_0567 family metalloprotein [Oceanobacter mangrovi]|uniref:CCE_0567 family metalloprotein n=1 Tax=Oceanobacter mangrovi TaxID=2862510 RepID=UPI001C8E9BE0|nr:CCE_0567 family metalloprotein [Oceanobacter mangrovi]